MTQAITLDIPHSLGRAGARARLEKGSAQIAGIVPGGRLTQYRWDDDTLHFVIEAMGQRVASRIEVREANIHAIVDLPPLAALLGRSIQEKLGQIGTRLLG